MPLCPPLLRLVCCLALAACSDLPEAALRQAPATGRAPAPVLLPLDQLLAQAQGGRVTQATTGGLAARAARLRARALLMQGPVYDAATRARLAAAMQAE